MNRNEQQIYFQTNRIKHLGIENELTLSEWQEILSDSNGFCFHCKKYVGIDFLTLDHLKPLKQNGKHIKSNVVASCFRCNCIKRDRTEFEPNSLEFIENNENTLTKRDLVKRLKIRDSLLAYPLRQLKIKPVGICNKTKRRVLYDKNVLDSLIKFFKEKESENDN